MDSLAFSLSLSLSSLLLGITSLHIIRGVNHLEHSRGVNHCVLRNQRVNFNSPPSFFECRRFVWNFFRLENEHLNNCGKFRTVRDIAVYPLDPKELGNQELGAEPPMLENIERQRQMPLVLSDVHVCSCVGIG